MWKSVFIGAMTLSSVSAYGQTAASVKCMTAGDDPRVTFEGELVITNISDLPTGGFSVVGRRIIIDEAQSADRLQACRDWYIHSLSWVDADGRFSYTYERRARGWNVINISQQNASMRMTCAVGSILTEYDNLDAYIDEYRQKVVEQDAPRPGRNDSTYGYVSGRSSVSAAECVSNQL